MSDLTEVKRLQKDIVLALEKGQDSAKLLKELADLRSRIASDLEKEELQRIANERQVLKFKAAKVQEKVRLQAAAIDAFLSERDRITSALLPILNEVKGLVDLQGKCYQQYRNAGSFAFEAELPEGYLPKDLTLPMLDGRDGVEDSYARAAEAHFYLSAGCGLLQSLFRRDAPIPQRPASEFESIEPSEADKKTTVDRHKSHLDS